MCGCVVLWHINGGQATDSLREFVLSFHQLDPWDQAQA